MRRSLLLALLASLVLAGCAGDDGGDDGTNAPPTNPTDATPTPDPTPTPASPTPVDPTPEPDNARERKTVYNGTHDFASAPTTPTAPRTEEFTVDEGYSLLEIRIVISAASAPTGELSLSTAKVRVLDATGAVVTECGGKDDPNCTKDVAAPAAGAWKVEYSGSGTVKATVTIAEDQAA